MDATLLANSHCHASAARFPHSLTSKQLPLKLHVQARKPDSLRALKPYTIHQEKRLLRKNQDRVALVVVAKKRRRKGSAKKRELAGEPSVVPRLIVFDLDNTIWTPELYQLRSSRPPVPWRDIRLFPAAQEILRELAEGGPNGRWRTNNTRVAIASRTHQGHWARGLLAQFEAVPGLSIHELASRSDSWDSYGEELIEIKTGSKISHFRRLRELSGLEFSDMLFFDDALGGKYGNCEPVAKELGVLSAHCPNGLTTGIWEEALAAYAAAVESGDPGRHHAVASEARGVRQLAVPQSRASGPAASKQSRSGTGKIKLWKEDKNYGFIAMDEGAKGSEDLFFHASAMSGALMGLAGSEMIGARVRFEARTDEDGRRSASEVGLLSEPGPADGGPSSSGDSVVLPCFSMSQPFAALLLNGVKTLETRNNPSMLRGYAGRKVLLHVGRKDWPDDEGWRLVLAEAGYSAADMERLSQLPAGFTKGAIAGIVELGSTSAVDEEAKKGGWQTVERSVVASRANMGKFSTEIRSAAWLKNRSVAAKGQPGVWEQEVPVARIPMPVEDVSEVRGAVDGAIHSDDEDLKAAQKIANPFAHLAEHF